MLNVYLYFDPKEFLRADFQARKESAESCTIEGYSEMLGFGRNSYSHQVMSGRRPITEKAAGKMCSALGLRGNERKYFVALCAYHYAQLPAKRDAAIQELLNLRGEALESNVERSQVEYFSEWYHAVIREMVVLGDFKPDPDWIARCIQPSISSEEAAYSLRLLQRLGYIEFDPKKRRWVQAEPNVQSPQEAQSLALIRFHRQMLENAKDSVLAVAPAEREIGAVTLALSEQEFSVLKSQLRSFRQDVVAKSAGGKASEREQVFQLNMQLFPLTKRQVSDA